MARRWSEREQGHSGGFTLVELLVALAVFAVVSVVAYGGLLTLLDLRGEVERTNQELSQLQSAFFRLGGDIEQAVDRPVNDEVGAEELAMTGGEVDDPFLALTRTGRANPRQWPRSALLRVTYALEEDRIVRRHWESVDRPPLAEPVEQLLMDGVQGMRIRFLDHDRVWREVWPRGATTPFTQLPRAVELVIEKAGWGEIRRLFRVRD